MQKNRGVSLFEVVISIALFTVLVVFLTASTPVLINKFKANAFKEQTLFLAKQKMEEYIYSASQQVDTSSGSTTQFGVPYEKFWYRINVTSYGNNLNMVSVRTWGPTEDRNRTNINAVNLIGLVKAHQAGPLRLPVPEYINSWFIAGSPEFIRVDNDGNIYVPTMKMVRIGYSEFPGYVISKYNSSGVKVGETSQYWWTIYGLALNRASGKLYVLGDGQYNNMTEFNASSLSLTRTNVLSRLVGGYQAQQDITVWGEYSYEQAGTPGWGNPSDFTRMLNAPFDVDNEGNFYVASAAYSGSPGYYRNYVAIIKVDQNGNRLLDSGGQPIYWQRDRYKPILKDIKTTGTDNFWITTIGSGYSSFAKSTATSAYSNFFGITSMRLGSNNNNTVYSFSPSDGYNIAEEVARGQIATMSSSNMFSPLNMAVTSDGEVFSGGTNYYPRNTGSINIDNVNQEGVNIRRFGINANRLEPVSKFGRYGDTNYSGLQGTVTAMDASPDGKRLYVIDSAAHAALPGTPSNVNYGRIVVYKLKD